MLKTFDISDNVKMRAALVMKRSPNEKTMPGRARPNAERLFNRYDFHSVGQHQRKKMAEAVGEADSELIRSGDIEELARQFANRFAVKSPTLIEAALSVAVEG